MERVSVLGIDLAKDVFQLHGVDERGVVVLRRKLRRSELMAFMSNLAPCRVGMEVCGGANHWGRHFQQMGHDVGVMSPQFVKPYRKSGKNDSNDAEAICEAVSRPNMRFVQIKSIAQQDIQSMHRVRRGLLKNRTAVVNKSRGLSMEFGIVMPRSIQQFRKRFPLIIDDMTNELTPMTRQLFRLLLEELRQIDQQVEELDRRLMEVFKQNEICQRISQIEGIGPITATAIVGSVSDPTQFKNGRQFAACFGLVPKQDSSGGRTVLLGIHKRGDSYIRTLLVHGARSALRVMRHRSDSKSVWVTSIMNRRGHNKACVALANKNARQIWAMLAKGEEYRKAA